MSLPLEASEVFHAQPRLINVDDSPTLLVHAEVLYACLLPQDQVLDAVFMHADRLYFLELELALLPHDVSDKISLDTDPRTLKIPFSDHLC
jgi:hypothetical protein